MTAPFDLVSFANGLLANANRPHEGCGFGIDGEDDPQAPTVSLAAARRYAFLRRFCNGAEYRIVNDDGEQLWSTQEE